MKIGLGTTREPKELRPRVFIVVGFFLLGLLVLAVNLYRLMVVRYEEFLALSVDNEFKDTRVRATRASRLRVGGHGSASGRLSLESNSPPPCGAGLGVGVRAAALRTRAFACSCAFAEGLS